MAFATSGLETYSSGSPAATRDPVSTRMREIGPFTCVMAWVVWSASQSTVPVVRTETAQEVLRTGTIAQVRKLVLGHREQGCVRGRRAIRALAFHLLQPAAGRLKQARSKQKDGPQNRGCSI